MRREVWRISAQISVLALTLILGMSGSPVRAGWADPLFQEKAWDFGPVPRGAKVRHAFALTNRLGEPVTIADVRASCGCTTGRPSASVVPPGGSAVIEAEMDTRNFVGKKATTLYVTLFNQGGQESEVRLGVSSTILSDIVLNPGTLDFGVVARGQTPSQSMTIERVGQPNWQIGRMTSACKAISATLQEGVRTNDAVGYELTVAIRPDAPAGAYRDEIHLMTNDPEAPVVPVQVTATVLGGLTATPSVLSLGSVPAGATGEVQGRFLVRGARPFVARSIAGAGDGFAAKVDNDQPAAVHVVTIAYRPVEGQARGDLRRVFRLQTDLADEPPLDLTVNVRVGP